MHPQALRMQRCHNPDAEFSACEYVLVVGVHHALAIWLLSTHIQLWVSFLWNCAAASLI